jgi:hypothetical protein
LELQKVGGVQVQIWLLWVFLCFLPFKKIYVWCKSMKVEFLKYWEVFLRDLEVFRIWNIWLECFGHSKIYLKALKVFRLQYHMTSEIWVLRSFFEIVRHILGEENLFVWFEYLKNSLEGGKSNLRYLRM